MKTFGRGFSPHALKTLGKGFSLLELAIALAVVGLLLGGLLIPLSTQVAQRNESATQKQLDEIKEALLGFAAANGRLPCPASAASKGLESFAAGGDASNGDCGNASGGAFIGFVPGVTLGLSQVDAEGFAVDAWGNNPYNRIRYAVSSDTLNSVQYPFTRFGGMRSATMSWVASAELLHVCATGTGVALTGGAWHCAAGGDATNTLTFNIPGSSKGAGTFSPTGVASSGEAALTICDERGQGRLVTVTKLGRAFVTRIDSGCK